MRALFTAGLLIFFCQTQAQDGKMINNQNRHEFRLDALEALAIPNLEINYEYVISKYSGAGLAASISLDDDHREYQSFAIEPYYRQYFLNKKDFGARGLFVEGLLRFAGGEEEFFDTTTGSALIREENWTDMGIGLVLGQKWVSDNGFVLEISIGGGRYLLDESEFDGFFKGGVLIGYRFF